MTPTQWLAIPTEIRLADMPNLTASNSEEFDEPGIYLNGSKIVIKEEESVLADCDVEDSSNASVFFYPVGNGLLSPSPDVSTKFETECSASSLPGDVSLPTELVILKTKIRNPDYRVKNNTIATKRGKPVNFKVIRGKPGLVLQISLAYSGHIYEDEPVRRCKKHDECTWCKEHEYNQSFCVISKFHKFELDIKGQPTAIVTLQEAYLDKEGSAEFSIVFSCWNSCDTHSRFGKELSLRILILENQPRKIQYGIHCCENLLRDAFKDRKREMYSSLGMKRKLVPSSDSNQELNTQGGSGDESRVAGSHTANTKMEKPLDLVIEGLDAERRDIIERMVKIMGGRSYQIPHLTKLDTCNTISKEEH